LILAQVTGTNLNAAVAPRVTVLRGTSIETASAVSVRDVSYNEGDTGTAALFTTPPVVDAEDESMWLRFSFDGASVVHYPLQYVSNPTITIISPLSGAEGTIIRITGTTLDRAGKPSVLFGGVLAQVVDDLSDDTNLVVTLPPRTSADSPTRVNVTLLLGEWNTTHPQLFNYTVAAAAPANGADGSSVGVVVAGPVVGVLLLMVLVATALYWRQRKRRAQAEREMVAQINAFETQVVDAVKQGFAELQSDSTLAMDSQSDEWAKPRSLEEFMLRVCYTHRKTHPVPMAAMPRGYSDVIEQFTAVLYNERFIRAFARVIESTAGRSIADKCHIAALLQVRPLTNTLTKRTLSANQSPPPCLPAHLPTHSHRLPDHLTTHPSPTPTTRLLACRRCRHRICLFFCFSYCAPIATTSNLAS
jgi:hypothetical protein